MEARAYVEACTKKGLPAKVTPYGCSAISKACSRIAQPKTITAITTVPGNTKYSTVTAPKQCNTITAPKKIVSVTTTVTNGPSTQTATVTPPVITSTVTNPALNATVTVTIVRSLPFCMLIGARSNKALDSSPSLEFHDRDYDSHYHNHHDCSFGSPMHRGCRSRSWLFFIWVQYLLQRSLHPPGPYQRTLELQRPGYVSSVHQQLRQQRRHHPCKLR